MGLQGRPPPGRKLRRGVLWGALGPGGGRWGKGAAPLVHGNLAFGLFPRRLDGEGKTLAAVWSTLSRTEREPGLREATSSTMCLLPGQRRGAGGRGTEERGAQLLVHARWQHVQACMRAGPVWHRAAQVGLGEGRRAPVLHHVGPACHLLGPWQSQDRYQEQTGSPSTAAELYWDWTNTPSFSVVGSRVHRTLPHRDPPGCAGDTPSL